LPSITHRVVLTLLGMGFFWSSALPTFAKTEHDKTKSQRLGAKRRGRTSHRHGVRQFVDVNRASVEELTRVPGVGRQLAEAIVASRNEQGEFSRPVDLLRVKGIAFHRAPLVARYLIFPDATFDPASWETSRDSSFGQRPSRPIDLNLAPPSELAPLPFVGWGLAYRIVAERDKNGPFRTLDDLLYVSGISTRHLETWRPYLYVERQPPW